MQRYLWRAHAMVHYVFIIHAESDLILSAEIVACNEVLSQTGENIFPSVVRVPFTRNLLCSRVTFMQMQVRPSYCPSLNSV